MYTIVFLYPLDGVTLWAEMGFLRSVSSPRCMTVRTIANLRFVDFHHWQITERRLIHPNRTRQARWRRALSRHSHRQLMPTWRSRSDRFLPRQCRKSPKNIFRKNGRERRTESERETQPKELPRIRTLRPSMCYRRFYFSLFPPSDSIIVSEEGRALLTFGVRMAVNEN